MPVVTPHSRDLPVPLALAKFLNRILATMPAPTRPLETEDGTESWYDLDHWLSILAQARTLGWYRRKLRKTFNPLWWQEEGDRTFVPEYVLWHTVLALPPRTLIHKQLLRWMTWSAVMRSQMESISHPQRISIAEWLVEDANQLYLEMENHRDPKDTQKTQNPVGPDPGTAASPVMAGGTRDGVRGNTGV